MSMRRFRCMNAFSFENIQQHRMFKTAFYILVFLCTSVLVLYKCRFGFGNMDEAFYLATPLRLFQGDALFVHEWHLSQLSSVLLWPIVSAFVHITGGCEGIILSMRYVCTAVQLLTSFFLYMKLRKHHWFGAVLASISFALYTPFGIMALSYNSMGILSMTISLVILLTAEKPMHHTAAGIVFSAAVLCCPYLAALYFLYMLICIFRGKKKSFGASVSVRDFGFFTLGVGVAAAAFLTFVFSRASMRDLIASIPFVLSDPEHSSFSLIDKTFGFFHSILTVVPVSREVHVSLLILFVVCLLDKKKKEHAAFYLILSILAVLRLLHALIVANPFINYIMWPMNLLAPFVALLSSHKAIRRMFFMVYCPGIFYTFCINLTSNQNFSAISSASCVSAVASIMMLCLFASECRCFQVKHPIRMIAALCLAALFILQLSAQVKLRYESVFWEEGMRYQTQYIVDGIYKGMLVSIEKEKLCFDTKEKMDMLEDYAKPGDKVLFLSHQTWYYLMGDYENSAYSAWLSGINETTIDRLDAYYSINPQKKPDVVYADATYGTTAHLFADHFGYSITETAYGLILRPL